MAKYTLAVKALVMVTLDADSPAVAERKVQEIIGGDLNRGLRAIALYNKGGHYQAEAGAVIAPILDRRGMPTIEGFLDQKVDNDGLRRIRTEK